MSLRHRLQRASSRRAAYSLLLALIVLGSRALRAQDSGGSALPSARAQIERGEWTSAEATLRRYTAEQPRSAEALFLLGRVLQVRNEPRDSLACFTRAAAIAQPSPEDLRIVALDYILLADYPDALRWLHESLKADPRNAEAWYDLARAHMTQGDFRGAQQLLEKALTLAPGMVKAENNLGLVFQAENRPAEALAAYRTAIAWQQSAVHPSEQPLLNYGTLLVEQQKGADAIPVLEKTIVLAPKEVKAHEQLARALDQTGALSKAIAEMQQAVSLDPKSPRLHYQLGQMYRHAGNADLAKHELSLSGQLYGTKSSEPAQP